MSSLKRVFDALLGAERHQRVRASQALVSLSFYLGMGLVTFCGVQLGLIDADEAVPMCVVMMIGTTGFYAAIRSGFNQRFASDPALTLPQGLFSVFITTWGYAITGPMRAAAMMVMVVTLMFGMFALRPRQVLGLGLFSAALLGSVMLRKSLTHPEVYAPRVEAMHFMVAIIVLPMLAVLAGLLCRMRERLHEKKAQLQQALEQIRLLATRDELTGVHNRRHLIELMEEEIRRHERAPQSMCLALLDIDHFKRINDLHGHAAGDAVLRDFARSAGLALRGTDTLGRWGGEEFMLMFARTASADAEQALARVREQVEALRFEGIATGLGISFSAGLTEYRGGESLAAAIERADRAMYRAKHAGRGCTALA